MNNLAKSLPSRVEDSFMLSIALATYYYGPNKNRYCMGTSFIPGCTLWFYCLRSKGIGIIEFWFHSILYCCPIKFFLFARNKNRPWIQQFSHIRPGAAKSNPFSLLIVLDHPKFCLQWSTCTNQISRSLIRDNEPLVWFQPSDIIIYLVENLMFDSISVVFLKPQHLKQCGLRLGRQYKQQWRVPSRTIALLIREHFLCFNCFFVRSFSGFSTQ